MRFGNAWAELRECLLCPRNRSSPRHEDTGMRPNLTNRTESEKRHQDYLDRLPVPTLETVEHIAEAQEEREREIDEKYEGGGDVVGTAEADRRDKAASTIQVNVNAIVPPLLSGENVGYSYRTLLISWDIELSDSHCL